MSTCITNDVKIYCAMKHIASTLQGSRFSNVTREGLCADVQLVANYLEIDSIHAELLSVIFYLNIIKDKSPVILDDIAMFLDVDKETITPNMDAFKFLVSKEIILSEEEYCESCHYDVGDVVVGYTFKKDIFNDLLVFESDEIEHEEDIEELEFTNTVRFIHDFNSYLMPRRSRELSYADFKEMVIAIENSNLNLNLIKYLRSKGVEIEDRFIFYSFCYNHYNDMEFTLSSILTDLFDNSRRKFVKVNEFSSENNSLQKIKLITNYDFPFTEYLLTDLGVALLLGNERMFDNFHRMDSSITQPETIQPKQMFFEPETSRQIEMLSNSISVDNYELLQKRLASKNMPIGVCAIFYGESGTGKTETAYQIAKSTGRSIMQVDISDYKSKYFGESEKLVKNIFTSYKNLCKNSDIIPILLVNEADALFSKRLDIETSLSQTENNIQNILLEELEKINGIMIATTNLNGNMDLAFERRFLFKIKFSKPTVSIKSKIWVDKLPWIDEKLAFDFAAKFDFTGAEIENIARKVSIEEVITDKLPSYNEILQMCQHERFSSLSSHKRVGF